MTGILIRGRNLDLEIHAGRSPYEDEGRDEGDVSVSQGMPKVARISLETGTCGTDFSATAPRRDQFVRPMLILKLWNCEMIISQ